MNGYLAVGGVSAVLRSLLLGALTDGGPATLLSSPTSISATSPDLVPTGSDEQPRLNLFMYYASFNTGYRNVQLPSRDSAGGLLTNPPLALNLTAWKAPDSIGRAKPSKPVPSFIASSTGLNGVR